MEKGFVRVAEGFKAIDLLNELLLEMGFIAGIDHKLSGHRRGIGVIKFTLPRDVMSPTEDRHYYLLYCSTTGRMTLLTGVFEILEAIWDLKDNKLEETKRCIYLADPDSLTILKQLLENLKKAHWELEARAVEVINETLGHDDIKPIIDDLMDEK